MPLFRYFAVVGSILVGLLYAVDANYQRPGPMATSSESINVPQGGTFAASTFSYDAFWGSAPESTFAANSEFRSVTAVHAADDKSAVANIPEQASASVKKADRTEPRKRAAKVVRAPEPVEEPRYRTARNGAFGLFSSW